MRLDLGNQIWKKKLASCSNLGSLQGLSVVRLKNWLWQSLRETTTTSQDLSNWCYSGGAMVATAAQTDEAQMLRQQHLNSAKRVLLLAVKRQFLWDVSVSDSQSNKESEEASISLVVRLRSVKKQSVN